MSSYHIHKSRWSSPNLGFKLLFFISVIVFSMYIFYSNAQAQDRNDALDASEEGDYILAFNLWTNLAKSGDSVAQYNLGVFYSKGLGTKPNVIEANRWFSLASQHGLVQAYNRLKSSGIKASGLIAIQTAVTPQYWVEELSPSNYTLQLASSKSIKLIEKYYYDNNLQGQAGYYTSLRKGEKWYALVYGSYPSVSNAKIAIQNIPKNLRKWSPWVRKIKDIHSITYKKH